MQNVEQNHNSEQSLQSVSSLQEFVHDKIEYIVETESNQEMALSIQKPRERIQHNSNEFVSIR